MLRFRGETVRWALLNPKHIFRGVRDDDSDVDDDGWLCYVAKPTLTEEREVYQWYWVDCDPDNPYVPVNHRERFKTKVF